MLSVLLAIGAACAGTGFGAAATTQLPSATVLPTISLADPTALAATPPVCGDAVAPLDTDDCGDVTFSASPSPVLSLGSLAGTDVQAGALTWAVSTTSVTGYRAVLYNPGPAPVLRGPSDSVPDLPASPMTAASAVDDATGFGVAVGNASTDAEGAVSFTGSSWVTPTGAQGELFRDVPTGGVTIAERATPQTDDPFTVTFAAASIASDQPTPDAYAGEVRLIASII